MASSDDSASASLTPEQETAIREILGYLNFSSGTPDGRFQQNVNRLHAWLTPAAGGRGLRRLLEERLDRIQAESPAFKDSAQARAVISLVFDDVLPAYRRHHADLLFHVADEFFAAPFFIARVAEATLAQGPPWNETGRITEGALAQLNDFLGHRPAAVLENGRQMLPYAHERFRPVPLFLRGAGVAAGRYHDLIAGALDILATMPADILAAAHFDPAQLDELALDVRAYDHSHPVYKRTNYTFGEWDPHFLDGSGRYRRFVLRSIILEALEDWMAKAGDVPAEERVREASAVLAGTMLMASSVSGSNPHTHDSNTSLTSLLPRIARQRDAFYARLLQSMQGKHGDRLRREAQQVQQPFGRIRQHLNLFLAHYGCRQMQRSYLAYLFARMGYPEAARSEAAVIPSTATRFETEIQLRLTLAQLQLDRGQAGQAAALCVEAEELLDRGIECGAIVDPWNILGFQGQFPLFASREDAVADPRVDRLLALMEQTFNVYSRLLCEAAAAGDRELCATVEGRFCHLADAWDRYASTTVSDLPAVHGGESFKSAQSVTTALSAWHEAGEAAGDVAFWKQHAQHFQSPRSYAVVIELLLRKKDVLASMNLLIQWLSESHSVPLESGPYSFFPLLQGWLSLALAGPREAVWPRVRKFFDYLEVNAGDWAATPAVQRGRAGALELGGAPVEAEIERAPGTPPGKPGNAADDEDDADEDDEQSLFSAAYENVVFRDSAQDGHAGDTIDESGPEHETDLDVIAAPIEQRLRFLTTLSQCWRATAEWAAAEPEAHDPARAESPATLPHDRFAAIRHWEEQNDALVRQLGRLMDDLSAWDPPEPDGDPDSLGEYDRQMHVKFGLVNSVISAGVALSETARHLKLLTRTAAPGRASTLDDATLDLLQHVVRGNTDAVRRALPAILKDLTRQPLLYVPLDRGGRPRDILAARNLQALIRTLLVRLPRQGLLRETWHVLRTAYVMERTSPPGGMSITEFDRLLEAALQSTLECVVAASARWPAGTASDAQLVDLLSELLEVYVRLWLKHSATMRLSSVEVLKEQGTWRRVKSFIRKYGGDLFHPRMLTMGNLRGIVQRGAEDYLEYLSQNQDPLHPITLLDDLDGAISAGEAAYLLELILRCVVEKFDRFLEYNTTTTQSDYGEQLHCLLDFLRLEAEYERQAWNLAPFELAHEALSRQGRSGAAALWQQNLAAKTGALARQYLQKLKRLEKQYGIRLPSITDRLGERFVKPLALDRILALVRPAMREARGGVSDGVFAALRNEAEEYLSTTSGSALELQPWLQSLAEEVQQVEAELAFPGSPLTESPPPADVPIDPDELRRQLRVWEQPLDGSAAAG